MITQPPLLRRSFANAMVGCTLIACTARPADAPRSSVPVRVAPPPSAPASPSTPRLGATASSTDEAVFEAICGAGNAAEEKGRHGCIACPPFTAAGESGNPNMVPAPSSDTGATPHVSTWSMFELRGSFTRPGAREMVVTLGGAECEGHATSYGGTVLLDLTTTPRIVEYEQGFVPSECKPHAVENGRTALLCRTGWFGMGVVIETLTIRDFSKPWDPQAPPPNSDVFAVESDEGSICGLAADTDRGPFIAAHVLDFDWADTNQDGKPDVTATLRYAVFTGTAAPFKKHCANQAAVDAFVEPRQRTARLDFEGDGAGKWSPTTATKSVVTQTRGQNTAEP